jgi:alkylation response protein AidB-like acyl-CoA dehydrogenase
MNLQYTTEQNLLRESAGKFLAANCDYASFRKITAGEPGWNAELWKEFARLGWLGLPFAEDQGGIGGGAVEVAILMEAFGRSLVVEPYLATVILGGGLVAALGSQAQREALLLPLIDGRLQLAFAHEGGAVPVTAKRSGSNYVLAGTKKMVLGAPGADQVLVSATLGEGATGVFVLPRSTPGLGIRAYPLVHGARAADMDFGDVIVPSSSLLGGNANAAGAIARAIDRAIAALSADAVGAMHAIVDTTVEYTKTRVQFGQPIARFQALQHRMVEMKIREEEARGSCLLATLSLAGSFAERARAVSGAKAKIGRCARAVHQAAIQLHGAIGTTDELSLGAYAKRLLAYEMLFGTTREHLRRYTAIIADPGIAAPGLLHEPAGS